MRKDGMKTDKQNDRGSVLMEFLIVAPLYLLLLGGMMLTGELLTANIKLWEHDRTLAWIADDRHFESSAEIKYVVELVKKSFELPDVHVDSRGNSVIKRDHYTFDNDNISESEWITASVNEDGDDKYVLGNFWGRLYNSQMQLKMNTIPASIRAPMAVFGIFSKNGDTSYIPSGIDFYRGGSGDSERPKDRHYVVHRFLHDYDGDVDLYDRSASAKDMLDKGIVWNVIEEPWIRNEQTSVKTVSEPDEYEFAHERVFLSVWSE